MDKKRRDFLKKVTAGSFLALDYTDFSMKTSTKRVELAIATITCDGFGDRNFEKAFEIIPQLPFVNVEFNCWYARNLTPSGLARIRDRCSENGLKPICIQGATLGASGNLIKEITHKIWNLEAARRLGCRRVKFTGSARGNDGGLDSVIQVLKELAPIAEEMDILVLVENHASNNIETLEDYDEIFSAVDSSHVGMCMDNAHFDGANIDLMDVVDRFFGKILHIDLKETQKKGVHQIVNFGEGVTDNKSVVEAMLSKGYEGYLLVEMAPPRDEGTLIRDLTDAYNLFQKYER